MNFQGRVEVDDDKEEKGPPTGLHKLGSGGGAAAAAPESGAAKQMPPTSVMTRLILIMVWRKLIRNPNTYSSLIGLAWSLIAFRYCDFHFLCFCMSL